jgi:hypothetical protein
VTPEKRKYHRDYMRSYNSKRYADDPEYRKKKLEASRGWAARNPGRMKHLQRRASLKHRYGLTPEEFDALLTKQNNECAICYSPEPGASWHIDHCHDTGRVRGVLCQRCNMALGLFTDDPTMLEQAVKYLANPRR